MNNDKPDTAAVLAQLKDFQRDTVEYVFRRMYLDPDCVRRFLIADEVGLGKTLVARGLIARTIDHHWTSDRRIDVVYVCSNTDIARQNINRLNVTGHDDFELSSRITLLPITIGDMQQQRLYIVSFTPGTSFDLKDSAGRSDERELLYWLLLEPWSLSFNKATCVLQAYANIDGFRDRVRRFPERYTVHRQMADQFATQLQKRPDLRQQFDSLCEIMPRAGATVSREVNRERSLLIGELRKLLAQTCLRWLEPDLIILDEFQRFKHLLEGDDENASESAQLAHHLFNYQEKQDDPTTAARVLLLSATPYKMYTLSQEAEQDDHYGDFRKTLDFLLPAAADRQQCHTHLQGYREELLRLTDNCVEGLTSAKSHLEGSLRRVMVRTERLAVSSDRNGMLKEVAPTAVTLETIDVRQYLSLQRVARSLDQNDVMEYWKAAPYLLNFMDEYELKRRLRKAIKDPKRDPRLIKAVRSAHAGLLEREEIESYRRIDPANARLRALHRDVIESGAWQLLWIPPSLSYYQGGGPFADPKLAHFTKRLVFSCWRVVPKAVASVLSYEAERQMMLRFRPNSRNTAEAREKRKQLLRFQFSKGRPSGMPALGLTYPCQTLAKVVDPLLHSPGPGGGNTLPTLAAVLEDAGKHLAPILDPILGRASSSDGPVDEAWYWAAPLLLDFLYDETNTRKWLYHKDVAAIWHGDKPHSDASASGGWERHVQLARDLIRGKITLGRPPEDLGQVLAQLAIAGPGVVALRALTRVCGGTEQSTDTDLRTHAAPLAHAFLPLFNLPEVMALIRDKRKDTPYWRSVLEYCAAGNLQTVVDEFCHTLIESLGVMDKAAAAKADKVSKAVQRCLTMRTSNAQADIIVPGKRSVTIAAEKLRLRTRFAMRFGDQEMDDSSEPTRADQVRAAFNSPFWPFVLATTSVGQEGLDFHTYCHVIVHWNLPSNPVDLEQREGRIHRFKGHALRKNIAEKHSHAAIDGSPDPWVGMFSAACRSRQPGQNDLFPFWVAPDGTAKIERHVPALPHSREVTDQANLRRSLVLYRMVFGQNRQEDLVDYLTARLPESEIVRIVDLCRVDVSPPIRTPELEP